MCKVLRRQGVWILGHGTDATQATEDRWQTGNVAQSLAVSGRDRHVQGVAEAGCLGFGAWDAWG